MNKFLSPQEKEERERALRRMQAEEHKQLKGIVLSIADETSKLDIGELPELERFVPKGVRDFYELLRKARREIQPTPIIEGENAIHFKVYWYKTAFDAYITILNILIKSKYSHFVQALSLLSHVDSLLANSLNLPPSEYVQLQKDAEGSTIKMMQSLKDTPVNLYFITMHRVRQSFATLINFYPPDEPMLYTQLKQLIYQDIIRIADESIEAQKQSYLHEIAKQRKLKVN